MIVLSCVSDTPAWVGWFSIGGLVAVVIFFGVLCEVMNRKEKKEVFVC